MELVEKAVGWSEESHCTGIVIEMLEVEYMENDYHSVCDDEVHGDGQG